ncbi:unnamed protein product [Gongylonema pulchrum]|uniref:PDZ domain-containing protein n=1 Tax=Gongylonema pulchrum TaxID=637853 RepID=A0A183DR78_9BILA|nr:unnamed protein product [Gongylonema pulchrum]
MLIYDSHEKKQDSDECNKCEREVRLEPDTAVSGVLAFRLAGNRTRGVFVRQVNQKSEQSKILRRGDQILEVNGINVRRLTCDQIANMLRLAVYNNGYARLQIGTSTRSRQWADGSSRDENWNIHYYYPIASHENSALPMSTSDMTGLCKSKLQLQAIFAEHANQSIIFHEPLCHKEKERPRRDKKPFCEVKN